MYYPLARLASFIAIGFYSLALPQPGFGNRRQTKNDDLKPPYEIWRDLRPASNRQLLGPLLKLQSQLPGYLASARWRSDFCQMYGTELSFVGRDREAIKYFDQVFPNGQDRSADFDKLYPRGDVLPVDLAGFVPEDAVAAITTLAAQRQVVMINEAHHVPQHRLTTLLLLESLWHRDGTQ